MRIIWCLYIVFLDNLLPPDLVASWKPILEEATSCDFFILVLCERNAFFVIMVHEVWKVKLLVVPYPDFSDLKLRNDKEDFEHLRKWLHG